MADKAQRTLATLTERLDRHRGAGQQPITVKQRTVPAARGIVTGSAEGNKNPLKHGWGSAEAVAASA